MSITMDPAVVEALEYQLGHEAPFDDGELRELRTLNVSTARTLAGVERCTGLTMLILQGCDVVDLADLAPLTALDSLHVSDSALTSLAGMPEVPLIQFDVSRNLLRDLTPMRELRSIANIDTIGNPLTAESYEEVIPELIARKMYVTYSGRREWELTVRMRDAGLPFCCYRSQNVLRLNSPGMAHTAVPHAGHPVVTEDELERALDEAPDRIFSLFERGAGLWNLVDGQFRKS